MATVVGSVAVEVVPSAKNWNRALRAQLLPEAQKLGDELGQRIGQRIAAQVGPAVTQGIQASLNGGGGAGAAVAAGRRAGDEYGGGFDRAVRTKIAAALKELPPISIGAAGSADEQSTRDLTAQLQALRGKTIGVDIDAATALAEIEAIKTQLDALAARSPNIQVSADITAASAQLAAIQAQATAVGAMNPTVSVSDGGTAIQTVGRIGMIISAALAMGPAIIPVAAAVAAALGGIGVGALAGVAGIGVLALGLSGIFAGVKALGKPAAVGGGGGASAASNAAAAQAAANAVLSAQRGLEQANYRVADSETALTRAQRDATRAQQSLNDARKKAREDLEDIGAKVVDNALAQRQAALDLAQAQRDVTALNSGGSRATRAQKDTGQLALDQAQNRANELAREGIRLAAEQSDLQAKGIDNADAVIAATDKNVDAQVDLEKAQRDVQLAVQEVGDAQRRLEQAYIRTETAGVAAAGGVESAFDKLSPTAQRFARFLYDTFLPALAPLKDAAQAVLLPALQRALETLIPVIPQLTPLIGGLAGALGSMFQGAADWIAGPDGQAFISFLVTNLPGWLETAGKIVGGVAGGFAGLLMAFAPLATVIGDNLADLAGRFAGDGGDNWLQKFVDYMIENGPAIVEYIGDIVGAVGDIIVAFAPVGKVVLGVLGALARGISAIPSNDLKAIAAVIAVVAAAIFLVGIAIAVATSPVTLIILAIGLLVLGLILLYNHSELFRTIVNAVWDTAKAAFQGVLDAVMGVWNWVSDNWKLLLGILTGPIGAAILIITTHWDTIKSGFTGVKDWISQKIDEIVGFITGLPGRIAAAASGMWDGIKDSFRAVLRAIIGWWNDLTFPSFTIPSVDLGPFGSLGGQKIGGWELPNISIPGLADGATVMPRAGGTLALLAEAGRAESVVDTGMLNKALAQLTAAKTNPSGGRGGSTFNIQAPPDMDVGRLASAIDRKQEWSATRR